MSCLILSLLLVLPFLAGGSHIPTPATFLLNKGSHATDFSQDPGIPSFGGIPGLPGTYDYIVVGGGTAGIVMAKRLAAKRFSVALVEAGGLYQLEFSFAAVPAADNIGSGADPNSFLSPIDWGFVVRNVPGVNYRDIHYPRGKCLGGSSAVNYMIYQRPTKEAMQRWAAEVNDSSYLFDNVLPFYKKSIHFTPPNKKFRASNATVQFQKSAFGGRGSGPLDVTYANYAAPFSSWMKLGMESIGLQEAPDFNSGSLMGFQYCTSTIRSKDQTRSSSHSSFLKGSLFERHLTIYPHTLAKKILFDSKNRANGVQVGFGGLTYSLEAKREVIVSAGAFQSPQLLMVSGIGPAETLVSHSTKVISDLAGVGQNMWDHIYFGPSYPVGVLTFTKLATSLDYFTSQFLEYADHHIGPFTNPGADFLAWEKAPDYLRSGFSAQTKADLEQFPSDWPEIEYLSGSGYVGNNSDLLFSQPMDGHEYATILSSLVAPTSRGNVTIMSNDTADLPIVQPNWLDTEVDQQVAIASYKRIREAFHSKEMAPIVEGEEFYPGIQHDTDAEILEAIKNSATTIYHASCTCKMGKPDDSMAVVDSEARVFGVQGLRVVDASAFPLLPPGHPQSTVCKNIRPEVIAVKLSANEAVDMLAEKIADKIITSA